MRPYPKVATDTDFASLEAEHQAACATRQHCRYGDLDDQEVNYPLPDEDMAPIALIILLLTVAVFAYVLWGAA